MAWGEIEAKEFNFGTSSLRLVRVGNIVQAVFSNKFEARVFYADAAARFKRAEEDFRGR